MEGFLIYAAIFVNIVWLIYATFSAAEANGRVEYLKKQVDRFDERACRMEAEYNQIARELGLEWQPGTGARWVKS